MIALDTRVRVGRGVGCHHRTTSRGARVINVGDVVEDFELLDQQGDAVSLANLLQSGPVVVYFYIKAKTPG